MAEHVLEAGAEVLFHGEPNGVEGLGLHLVAALLELRHQFGREQAVAGGDDLTEFDVRGTERLGGDAQAVGDVGAAGLRAVERAPSLLPHPWHDRRPEVTDHGADPGAGWQLARAGELGHLGLGLATQRGWKCRPRDVVAVEHPRAVFGERTPREIRRVGGLGGQRCHPDMMPDSRRFVAARQHRVMTNRPFRVLGLQQIAIGGLDKGALTGLWTGLLGVEKVGDYVSESENVDEDILRLGDGPHAVEIDLMQPLDPERSPKVHVPTLNHVGVWIDDLAACVDFLTAQGVRFTPGGIRKGAAGHDVCFIHPKGNDDTPRSGEGVLIELVQAPPEIVEALAG